MPINTGRADLCEDRWKKQWKLFFDLGQKQQEILTIFGNNKHIRAEILAIALNNRGSKINQTGTRIAQTVQPMRLA